MKLWPLLLLGGCTFQPVTPGPLDGDCRSAYEHLKELNCEEAEPVDGRTFEDDCNVALKEGTMDPETACLSHVESCGDIPRCYE